jgi:hypothetical protein
MAQTPPSGAAFAAQNAAVACISGLGTCLAIEDVRTSERKFENGRQNVKKTTLSTAVAALAVLGAACSSSKGTPAPASTPTMEGQADAGAPEIPFYPVAPVAYVAKVKNILVGLPPTDDEVKQVEADPTRLKVLIGTWMQLPQYAEKMKRFFELAFQQTQVSAVDFADQAYPKQIGINNSTIPLLVQNAQQSFARTMLELINQGRPLTDGVTTQKLMMTTALRELYAFLDVWEVDDDGKITDRFKKAHPLANLTIETAAGPIPIADTLDPMSPNYMHWYNPDSLNDGNKVMGCAEDPIVIPATGIALHYLLYGAIDGHKSSTGTQCPPYAGTAASPQLTQDDFNDWKMITIRTPAAGEDTTPFYDLPKLRNATELVLTIPRVGFFSTPAFFANWQTNISNQMRVTLNQTLIVALGAAVDGTDTTRTPGSPPPGLDTDHAGAAVCSYCHQTLDPLRSIFSANYSWNYHNQIDPGLTAQKGMFSFQHVIKPVTNMSDMGQVLADHPLFPEAWAQKLCYYVNSSPCASDDPEFQRVVTAFKSSTYSWNTLITELLSSPLVTNASKTSTASTNGEVVAVSRRDHLCAAMNVRLGFTDVCGLNLLTKKQGLVPTIVSGLPSDGYGRGSTIPVLPNAPSLFYRAATENICAAIAAQVIDTPAAKQQAGVKQWTSADPDAAIADFVSLVMGLVPSDPRSAKATTILKQHYTSATQQMATPSDALKSTFVSACLAPSAVSIGL